MYDIFNFVMHTTLSKQAKFSQKVTYISCYFCGFIEVTIIGIKAIGTICFLQLIMCVLFKHPNHIMMLLTYEAYNS